MSDPGPPPADSTHLLKAVVLVVVVVIVALFILHRQGGSTSTSTGSASTTTSTLVSPSSSTTSTTVVLLPPAQVEVQVLNGTGAGSLAGTETAKLASSPGYATLPANNTTKVVTSPVIYSAAGFYAEGLQLAETVGLPASAVRHRIPLSAPLPSGVRGHADLVLVIAGNLASKV